MLFGSFMLYLINYCIDAHFQKTFKLVKNAFRSSNLKRRANGRRKRVLKLRNKILKVKNLNLFDGQNSMISWFYLFSIVFIIITFTEKLTINYCLINRFLIIGSDIFETNSKIASIHGNLGLFFISQVWNIDFLIFHGMSTKGPNQIRWVTVRWTHSCSVDIFKRPNLTDLALFGVAPWIKQSVFHFQVFLIWDFPHNLSFLKMEASNNKSLVEKNYQLNKEL